MHEQIGIAADRAGEMSIARQSEAEMTNIVGAIGGLRLAAQHHFADQLRFGRADVTTQHPIEIARMQLIAGWQRDTQRREEATQGVELGIRWRRMDPVHAGRVQAFQFLGGRDISKDHEFFDQPVTVEARAWGDAGNVALVVELDLTFG